MRRHRRTIFAGQAALALAAGAAALSIAGVSPGEARAAGESAAPAWAIQPGGRLGFAVVNNGSETVAGSFAGWGGDIRFDPLDPAGAAIRIDVDLASGSVGDAFKDKLLGEDEFFNVPLHPTATFESNSVEALPDGRFRAAGTLSLKGLSRPQEIEFTLSGSGASRHVEGNATIDRVGFDIGMGSYGGSLDKAVALTFAFDAARQ